MVAPTGADVIRRRNLRGVSTVSAAMKDLPSRDLVYKTDTGVVICDRLFGIWMSQTKGK